jgi:large subunit ribosomal protein L17
MRHHNANRKLSRESGQRRALLRSLARSLVIREKINTTEAKAKELRPFVEKMVTRGKNGTVATRRFLTGQIGPEAGKKIVDTLSPKFKERAGGYVRIIRMPRRISDGSPMAHVEFV